MSLQIFLLVVVALILAAVWFVGIYFGILWAGLALLVLVGGVILFIVKGATL